MKPSNRTKAFGGTFGAGTMIAFALSWLEHHSIVWAIVLAVYSWFYVAYYALTKSGALPPIDVPPVMTAAAVAIAALAVIAAFVAAMLRFRR